MIDGHQVRAALLVLLFAVLTACVTSRDAVDSGNERGERYLQYGTEAYYAGQPVVAASRMTWALRMFEKNGDLDGQLRAHINLAELALRRHDIAGAGAHIGQAEKLLARHANPQYRRRIMLIQSSIALQEGDLSRARSLLTGLTGAEGRPVGTGHPDAVYLAALVNRVQLAREQHSADFAQWVGKLARALAAAPKRDPALDARLLRFQGELYRRGGNFKGAEAAFGKALSIYEAAGGDWESGMTLSEWAEVDRAQGRWLQASRKLRRAILAMDKAGDRARVIAGMRQLAAVESRLGNALEARALIELAGALSREAGPYGSRVRELIERPADPG